MGLSSMLSVSAIICIMYAVVMAIKFNIVLAIIFGILLYVGMGITIVGLMVDRLDAEERAKCTYDSKAELIGFFGITQENEWGEDSVKERSTDIKLRYFYNEREFEAIISRPKDISDDVSEIGRIFNIKINPDNPEKITMNDYNYTGGHIKIIGILWSSFILLCTALAYYPV